MENDKKKVVWNNNCQNDIKFLKINNTVTNKPQEIPNTFTEYFLTVAGTYRQHGTDTSCPGDNVNTYNYWLINIIPLFQELVGTMPQLMKLIRLSYT